MNRTHSLVLLALGVLGTACSTTHTTTTPPTPVSASHTSERAERVEDATSAPSTAAENAALDATVVTTSLDDASLDTSTVAVVSNAQDAGPAPIPGMLFVPAGTFTMGADDYGEADERPAHQVTLAGFYLDETEVTNEAWERCISAGICPRQDPRSAEENHLGPDSKFRAPRQPVSSISWDAALRYCQWIGKRLPTEAEFERAVRGDDARRYAWGNDRPTPQHAVFDHGVSQEVATHPLGRGPFGHHDLAGNVWEWTADYYDPFAYRRPTASQGIPGTCRETLRAFDQLRREGRQGFTGTNPIPNECERVLRGGAFNYDWYGLRASNRVHHPGRYHLVMSGFRCARDEVVRDQ